MKKVKDRRGLIEELYRRYEQKVYRVAFNVLKNVEQAEDVTQEVFIQLYHSLDQIEKLPTNEAMRYILRITKNKAIDCYRKNQRQLNFSEFYQQKEAVNDNVAQKIKGLISEEEILNLIAAVPENYHEVLKYRIYYGLTSKETAEITGLTEVNVRKKFERGKKKISEMIGGTQDDSFKARIKNAH